VARHDRKYAIEVSASSVSRSEPSRRGPRPGRRVDRRPVSGSLALRARENFGCRAGRVGGLAHVVMDAKRDLVGQPPRTVPVPGRTCLTRESVSSASVRSGLSSIRWRALPWTLSRLSGGLNL